MNVSPSRSSKKYSNVYPQIYSRKTAQRKAMDSRRLSYLIQGHVDLIEAHVGSIDERTSLYIGYVWLLQNTIQFISLTKKSSNIKVKEREGTYSM